MNGLYKALEDLVWLTQLGLTMLLPLVLCLAAGGLWVTGAGRCGSTCRRCCWAWPPVHKTFGSLPRNT